jgi:hypothetical protein
VHGAARPRSQARRSRRIHRRAHTTHAAGLRQRSLIEPARGTRLQGGGALRGVGVGIAVVAAGERSRNLRGARDSTAVVFDAWVFVPRPALWPMRGDPTHTARSGLVRHAHNEPRCRSSNRSSCFGPSARAVTAARLCSTRCCGWDRPRSARAERSACSSITRRRLIPRAGASSESRRNGSAHDVAIPHVTTTCAAGRRSMDRRSPGDSTARPRLRAPSNRRRRSRWSTDIRRHRRNTSAAPQRSATTQRHNTAPQRSATTQRHNAAPQRSATTQRHPPQDVACHGVLAHHLRQLIESSHDRAPLRRSRHRSGRP